MPDVAFWSIAILAVFISGLSKSGIAASLGVVSTPLLSLVMAPREAAGLLLPLLLVMDVFAVWNYRHEKSWRNLFIMVPGAVMGISLGWALSAVVSDAIVLLAIGIIAMLFILDAAFPIRKKMINKAPSKPWGVFWGALTGFTSFIGHAGGPPYQIYTMPQRMSPTVYAGTSAWFFATLNVTKLVPYYFLGQLPMSNIGISMMLAPFAVMGVFAGIFLVRRISIELFYRIAYALVFLLSLKLIYDGTMGLIGG